MEDEAMTQGHSDQTVGKLRNDREVRALLDQLLEDSRLYKTSKEFQELLDFTVRLRKFAPFNAMLLQIQKPGLRFAASIGDWFLDFERKPKQGARPLLILWPCGPVALVYDLLDTEGDGELPRDVFAFPAQGIIDKDKLEECKKKLASRHIKVAEVDAGDLNAGCIQVTCRPEDRRKTYSKYTLCLNANHPTPTQFCTIAHELAHLFLGHLGSDPKLGIPDRRISCHSFVEIEAESVAYIVCYRNGVEPESQTYLSDFVKGDNSTFGLDLYQIMRAAGQVESILDLRTTR